MVKKHKEDNTKRLDSKGDDRGAKGPVKSMRIRYSRHAVSN